MQINLCSAAFVMTLLMMPMLAFAQSRSSQVSTNPYASMPWTHQGGWEKLRLDMTTVQAQDALGSPTTMEPRYPDQQLWQYSTHTAEGHWITGWVRFRHGAVAAWSSPSFDTPYINVPWVQPGTWNLLRLGMTTKEVEETLGSPTALEPNTLNQQYWAYRTRNSSGNWRTGWVRFTHERVSSWSAPPFGN
ncbi:MAG: hypothetical protein OJF61_001576 [Rhodanobacteraceae bacterium]|jgi:outer membrane protein assembly factor BamE (lipoprotein component of BamABCDE complex)|nr:MAG: hypothetical protein OJF61_001576 [Rhodanobacteraceae bacterium]